MLDRLPISRKQCRYAPGATVLSSRSSSRNAPKTYLHDTTPGTAQAREMHGVPHWAPGAGDATPSHTLQVNGVPVVFDAMDAPLSPAQVRTQIGTALKAAGVPPQIVNILAPLLCEPAFVDADGKAINEALAGKFQLGDPDTRELNVVVNDQTVTVRRRSTWSTCGTEAGQQMVQADLLTVDSGVTFHAGKDPQGKDQVLARPDYWKHATADAAAGASLDAVLSASSDGTSAWDRFADALASLLGAAGLRFERAENLESKPLKAEITAPVLPATVTQHIASFATPQARNAMLAVSKTFRTGAEQATEYVRIESPAQLAALKARLAQPDQRLIKLDGLSLCGNFTDADLADLPGNITKLDLSKCRGVTAAGLLRCLEGLAANLTDLNLRDCDLKKDFVAALVGLPFQQLTSLDLSGNWIGREGARALANSAPFGSLRSLNIGFNKIGDSGLRVIANSKILISLRSLNIEWNDIGDAGMQVLADSKTLSSLEWLNVAHNKFSWEGMRSVLSSTTLSLTSLLT